MRSLGFRCKNYIRENSAYGNSLARIGVHTFSDKWANQCLIFAKLSSAKSVSVDCIWLANERQRFSKDKLSLSVETDVLFVNQYSVFFFCLDERSDHSQAFTLITISNFEENGRSRGIQVYTVPLWKATLLLEGVFSEISPFFLINIALN